MVAKKLPKTDVEIRPLRTFEDDLAQAVEKQKETAISMSVKESEKRRKERSAVRPKKRGSSKKPLFYLSILFIIGGIVVLGFFSWHSRPHQEERVIIDTLIIADQTVKQDISNLDKQDFVELIKSLRQDQKAFSTVTHLDLVNNSVKADSEVILNLLDTKIPSVLLRSMSGESMFGLIQLQESSAPFWIIEVDSFENAFGGVLDWERSLAEDLGRVFSENSVPNDKEFRDVISKNKDLRVLSNDQNIEILVHGFLDKNTLIITENESAFREILPLFISSKQIR